MKKNLIIRSLMLTAMIAFMASCTKKASEYTHVIPADASAVVGVYAQSLTDKSGVSDQDKENLIHVMKGEINAAAFQHIEKIIKDGSASGLSTKDPIYFFVTDLLPTAAITMKINDVDKFNKTLEVILPEVSDGTVTKTGGYSTFKFDDCLCAFNESTLLVVASGYNEKIVSDLMKQRKEESIVKKACFENMTDKKGDIKFFFTPDVLPDMYKSQMNTTFYGIGGIDLNEIIIIGGLSFEKGRIALQIETTSENKEIREMLEKQNELYGKLNEVFLSNFPASTLAYLSVNADGEKLYGMLQENKDFRESLSLDKAEKIKEIFGAFKGDISIGLINVTMTDMPTFVAYAEATSGAALNTLYESKADLRLLSSEDIIKLGENQYVYKTRQMNIFFGYKDNYMYVTNDELINKNIGKKESNSLKDAIYAPNMKGKHQYAAINMRAILDLPVVKMLSAMGGREAAVYMDVASKASYFEVTGEGNDRVNINLWLVDRDTNSLKQIVDLVRQYAGI